MFTLNCKGKLVVINRPLVMGIINTTPDSFYEDSRKLNGDEALELAAQMITAGASILDMGGQSTRPSSKRITAAEETDRVLPIIETVHKHFPEIIISIDTYYASVAEKAVIAGASMVNDISGGSMDENMMATVGKLNVPYICTHIKDTPENMQNNPEYNNVTKELLQYFINKIERCKQNGIKDIIIDPGFGFGKTTEHNFSILKNLSIFEMLYRPVLAGISRKGMVYKTLNISAKEALNGTTVLHTIALLNGASILRVHDVKEAMEAVKLVEVYKENPSR